MPSCQLRHAQGGTCIVISDETNLAEQASKHFEDIVGCKACAPSRPPVAERFTCTSTWVADHVMLRLHAARCNCAHANAIATRSWALCAAHC